LSTLNILPQIKAKANSQSKSLAVLMDPDKIDESNLKHILGVYESLGVDYIFVGGSLLTTAVFDETISKIKESQEGMQNYLLDSMFCPLPR